MYDVLKLKIRHRCFQVLYTKYGHVFSKTTVASMKRINHDRKITIWNIVFTFIDLRKIIERCLSVRQMKII